MDDFRKALAHVLEFEGGYANNQSDRGGETFRGISRKSYPRWEGWKAVGAAAAMFNKSRRLIDRHFENDEDMERMVEDLYRREFWDRTPEGLPARTRCKVFDTGVNAGLHRAAVILQKALARRGARLTADGLIGPKTLEAANAAVEDVLLGDYCQFQASFYRDITVRRPDQTKFLRGWLSRAEWVPPAEWVPQEEGE
jgi:lysozyme family protein